jgi:hypothetical protein
MDTRHARYAVAAASMLGVLLLLFVSMPAAQQHGTAPASNTETPRLANGRPDFSGFYNRDSFTGDAVEEAPHQHVINRLDDGTVFYDYAGANTPQMAATALDPNQPPYKPEYMAKVQQLASKMYGGNSKDDPYMDCKPLGVPRAGLAIMHIVQNENFMAVMHEARPGPVFRVIYTDGRKHPERLDTSYMGHSIGTW